MLKIYLDTVHNFGEIRFNGVKRSGEIEIGVEDAGVGLSCLKVQEKITSYFFLNL
jgi:hypothetical protein